MQHSCILNAGTEARQDANKNVTELQRNTGVHSPNSHKATNSLGTMLHVISIGTSIIKYCLVAKSFNYEVIRLYSLTVFLRRKHLCHLCEPWQCESTGKFVPLHSYVLNSGVYRQYIQYAYDCTSLVPRPRPAFHCLQYGNFKEQFVHGESLATRVVQSYILDMPPIHGV